MKLKNQLALVAYLEKTRKVRYTPGKAVDSSLSGNRVQVRLGPPGAPWSGLLTLRIEGAGRSHTFFSATKSVGDHFLDFTLNNPSIPQGEYDYIVASWTTGPGLRQAQRNHRLNFLGIWGHTEYRTPMEGDPSCDPEPHTTAEYNYTTGNCTAVNCTWTSAQGASHWLDRIFAATYGTGNGMDKNGEVYTREWHCQSSLPRRLRRTGVPCPKCPTSILTEGDLAADEDYFTDGTFQCGDRVWIYGGQGWGPGLHFIRDKGSFNPPEKLDHYGGYGGCQNSGSLGNSVTIKLYDGYN